MCICVMPHVCGYPGVSERALDLLEVRLTSPFDKALCVVDGRRGGIEPRSSWKATDILNDQAISLSTTKP